MVRYALVVGITNYSSSYLPKLSKAAKDAEAVACLLERHGHFQQVVRCPSAWSQTQQRESVSTKRLLSGADLGQELQTFLLERTKKQEALIYFSGHGLTVTDSLGQREGYLTASDCQIEGIEHIITEQKYGISLDSLNRLIYQSDLSSLFVLLDCCHSGYFIERNLTEQTLNAFSRKKDYYLITASRNFEKAWEGESYSVFTEAVLEGLTQYNADPRGTITGDRLFDYVSHRLKGSGQEPIRLGLGRSILLVSYPEVEAQQEVTFNPHNPYKGLRAFEQSDRDYFYGRKRAVKELINRLGGDTRFLAIIGPSGCGKSSLVRAGLLPELENDALPGSSQWAIEAFTPGEYPLNKLEEALHHHQKSQQSLLIVIDQFEEIFTLNKGNGQATDQTQTPQWLVFRKLAEIVNTQEHPIRIIIALRIDFLEDCNPYPDAVGLINQANPSTYLVPPLEIDELEEAIEQPALKHGIAFESGLPSRIVADVLGQPGALPLLQYALVELWEACINSSNSSQRQIDRQSYTETGGVTGALDRRATSIYNNCPPDEQTIIHDLFMELVELGDAKDITRRRANLQQLGQRFQGNTISFERVLQLLSGQEQRLIVVDEETVEVAHEALLGEWMLLYTWIENDRENIRLRRRLESACEEWVEVFHESDDALLTGAQLAVFDEWIQRIRPQLREKEQELYLRSCERRDRQLQKQLNQERQLREIAEERQKEAEAKALAEVEKAIVADAKIKAETQRNRWFSASLILLGAITVLSMALRNQAVKSTKIAVNSLISKVEQISNSNYQLETLIESVRVLKQLRIIGGDHSAAVIKLSEIVHNIHEINRLEGHTGDINYLSFSPDGEIIASASADRTVRLWHTSGKLLKILPHEAPVLSVNFSPKQKLLVSSDEDGVIKLWNIEGEFIREINASSSQDTFFVPEVLFDYTGKLIAAASYDNSVKVWNIADGTLIANYQHAAEASSISFSPTAQTIASAGWDNVIRVWNMEDNNQVLELKGHEHGIYNIQYSFDGESIVSAGHDETIRIWHPLANDASNRSKTINGHEHRVYSVAFSPNSNLIASASQDKTVKLWDTSSRELNQTFTHENSVHAVAFSPEGDLVISGGVGKMIRIWRISESANSSFRITNTDDLVRYSCDILFDFLNNNRSLDRESKAICLESDSHS